MAVRCFVHVRTCANACPLLRCQHQPRGHQVHVVIWQGADGGKARVGWPGIIRRQQVTVQQATGAGQQV